MKATIIKNNKSIYTQVINKLNSLKSYRKSSVGRLNRNATNHLDDFKGKSLVNLITFKLKKTKNLGDDFEHTFYYDVETDTSYILDVNIAGKLAVIPAFLGDYKDISELK